MNTKECSHLIAKAIDSSLVHSHEDTYAWPKHNKVHAHSVPDPVNEENTKVKDTNVYIYVCVRMYISIQRERDVCILYIWVHIQIDI